MGVRVAYRYGRSAGSTPTPPAMTEVPTLTPGPSPCVQAVAVGALRRMRGGEEGAHAFERGFVFGMLRVDPGVFRVFQRFALDAGDFGERGVAGRCGRRAVGFHRVLADQARDLGEGAHEVRVVAEAGVRSAPPMSSSPPKRLAVRAASESWRS